MNVTDKFIKNKKYKFISHFLEVAGGLASGLVAHCILNKAHVLLEFYFGGIRTQVVNHLYCQA